MADFVPGLENGNAPTAAHVKERIAPASDQQLYDVFYAKGHRVYQCNPEKTRFEHWKNVQTNGVLYPTKGRNAPFDVEGQEIGQISAAPLNQTQQMSNPIDSILVHYFYPDGSWFSTGKPLMTTSREAGRKERGEDGTNLDDHLTRSVWTSTDGYFSHADAVVRLNTLNGSTPPKEACTVKGTVVTKPFTAFFMLYTTPQGSKALEKEKMEWDELVEKTRVA
ncbi:unnamed protein product [Absidia cylindrospora]